MTHGPVRAAGGLGEGFDEAWLNDRSEYQQNFVHGLRNPAGLRLQYRLEAERAVAEWTAGPEHAGFPGIVHGGLVQAVLDDVMGRLPAMLHRWVVTARMETRFRAAAPLGVPLRVEGWLGRSSRRLVTAGSTLSLPGGEPVAEASGIYMPVPGPLLERMLAAWPGFAEYQQGG